MTNETNSNNCKLVGLIIAALIVGVLSYFISKVAPMWVAVIAFLVLLGIGYWLAAKFCAGNTVATPVAAPVSAPAPVVEKAVVEPAPVVKAAAAKVAEAPVAAATESAPELLDKPRGGKGDDLKKIKGVGPKFESDLNEKGIWHYDQIAKWSASEVAWGDENLGRFRGRVSRDDWVGQAKTLAAGGTTEFSKKVDKGGVY